MRGKGTIIAVLDLFISSALTLIIQGDEIAAIYNQRFSRLGSMGAIAALMELLIKPSSTNLSDPLLIRLILPWLTAGLIGGLVSRKHVGGLYAGVLAGLLSSFILDFTIYFYQPTFISGISDFEMRVLLTRNIVYGFMVGVPTGLMGLFAGLISAHKEKRMIVVRPFPIETICPRCGFKFNSMPEYCSKCGNKLKT